MIARLPPPDLPRRVNTFSKEEVNTTTFKNTAFHLAHPQTSADVRKFKRIQHEFPIKVNAVTRDVRSRTEDWEVKAMAPEGRPGNVVLFGFVAGDVEGLRVEEGEEEEGEEEEEEETVDSVKSKSLG